MCLHGDGPHGKSMGMMGGIVLLVLGVLWWLTNAGSLDPAFWGWLLPLLVVLLGLKMLAMPMCRCGECTKMKEDHGEHHA